MLFHCAWVNCIYLYLLIRFFGVFQATCPAVDSSVTLRSSPALETAPGENIVWSTKMKVCHNFLLDNWSRNKMCLWPASFQRVMGHWDRNPKDHLCRSPGRLHVPGRVPRLQVFHLRRVWLHGQAVGHQGGHMQTDLWGPWKWHQCNWGEDHFCNGALTFFCKMMPSIWSLFSSSSPVVTQWSQGRMMPPASCMTWDPTRSSSPTRTPPSCVGWPPWPRLFLDACY